MDLAKLSDEWEIPEEQLEELSELFESWMKNQVSSESIRDFPLVEEELSEELMDLAFQDNNGGKGSIEDKISKNSRNLPRTNGKASVEDQSLLIQQQKSQSEQPHTTIQVYRTLREVIDRGFDRVSHGLGLSLYVFDSVEKPHQQWLDRKFTNLGSSRLENKKKQLDQRINEIFQFPMIAERSIRQRIRSMRQGVRKITDQFEDQISTVKSLAETARNWLP